MSEDKIRKAQGQRLAAARLAAGFRSARDAAIQSHWPESTYRAHEAGTRTIGHDDAEKYARRFKASAQTILFGPNGSGSGREVPLVGYVGAGALAHYYGAAADDPAETVPAPEGSTDSTVAVEIRGESLGALFDRWLVFYDDVRSPVTDDLIGKLCVVALADDRVLVKQLKRSRTKGLYHLVSNVEAPILDAEVMWAAKVKTMVPRE